jgi:hypothetical protein
MLRHKQQECCASNLASGLPADSTAAAAVLLAVELFALFTHGWAYFND